MKSVTYKSSGVDIKQADVFVRSIQGLMGKTAGQVVLKKHKAFGSLFALSKSAYKNPVLVSSTDGVGTKLLLAKLINKHDTVGIDLVAMNVNDVLCTGAKPLFFLDYIACGKVKPALLKNVVKGIAEGCRQANCSLIGGETAEMPGLYKADDYDLAGFAVGIVDRNKIIDGSKIKPGDILIGLASSGIHSNGYSLVRKVFSTSEQKKLAKELLSPTRIYVRPVLETIKRFPVKGIAHITGGAFYEKLTKIIPAGLCCLVYRGSWPVPKIFQRIKKKGKITGMEMFTTFNMGIGMVLIVPAQKAPAVIKFLKQKGVSSWKIGSIIKDKKRKIIL